MEGLMEKCDTLQGKIPDGDYLEIMNLLKETNDLLVYEEEGHAGHNDIQKTLETFEAKIAALIPSPEMFWIVTASQCHRELIKHLLCCIELMTDHQRKLHNTVIQLSLDNCDSKMAIRQNSWSSIMTEN